MDNYRRKLHNGCLVVKDGPMGEKMDWKISEKDDGNSKEIGSRVFGFYYGNLKEIGRQAFGLLARQMSENEE